ncbi:MAG: hypothetical protein ACOYKZ_04800 [Chlamydiia bacterium]
MSVSGQHHSDFRPISSEDYAVMQGFSLDRPRAGEDFLAAQIFAALLGASMLGFGIALVTCTPFFGVGVGLVAFGAVLG